MGINRAVLAIRPLRDAIGSEWSRKVPGSSVVYLQSVDDTTCKVKLSDDSEWNVMTFLREFKTAIPKDKIPSWYTRLLEDKLL